MSHPFRHPAPAHVESRSRKGTGAASIIQAATLLEIVLSGLVLIGLLLSFIPCSGGCRACCLMATMRSAASLSGR